MATNYPINYSIDAARIYIYIYEPSVIKWLA